MLCLSAPVGLTKSRDAAGASWGTLDFSLGNPRVFAILRGGMDFRTFDRGDLREGLDLGRLPNRLRRSLPRLAIEFSFPIPVAQDKCFSALEIKRRTGFSAFSQTGSDNHSDRRLRECGQAQC